MQKTIKAHDLQPGEVVYYATEKIASEELLVCWVEREDYLMVVNIG